MKYYLNIAVIVILSNLFFACDPENVIPVSDSDTVDYELATDYDWNATTEENISFNGSSVTENSDNIVVNGTTVTISKAGNYVFSGILNDGQLVVDADSGIVRIKFNGVTINNTKSAAIYVKKAPKTVLFLADGTSNSVTDAVTYTNTDEPNAAIFSNSFLSITGNGSLTVKGNYNDGISGDDGVVINNGNITVTAKDDAIRGKDYLIISNGTITASASTGHALKSDNATDNGLGFVKINGGNLTLTSTSADGVHGKKRVIINDGQLTISASGSQGLHADSLVIVNGGKTTVSASKEGVESPYITIAGGEVNVTASDDALNATWGSGGESNDKSLLSITGGNVYLNGTGGDGLDSNGSILMTGGTVVVHGPKSSPEVGIDYNGTFNLNGGFLIVSGTNSNMTQGASSTSTQNSVTIKTSASQSSIINIQDAGGNSLVTFKPTRSYYSIVFSSAALVKNASYSIYSGGTSTGSLYNGLYTNGVYSGGTLKKTFTVTATVTSVSF